MGLMPSCQKEELPPIFSRCDGVAVGWVRSDTTRLHSRVAYDQQWVCQTCHKFRDSHGGKREAPRSVVENERRFRGTYCLHHRDDEINITRRQPSSCQKSVRHGMRQNSKFVSLLIYEFKLRVHISVLTLIKRLWGPPSLLYNGYRGSFPRGYSVTGAWRWPLTPI
jgi:hypothetical protein